MSESKGRDGGEGREGDGGEARDRSGGRKLAEWVTMGLSAALVAAVAGYLAYQTLRGDAPIVPAEVRVLTDQAQAEAGKFVVPVEVRNGGRRTLKDFKVLVSYQSAGGEKQTSDFVIDYLGEQATQKVYLYFEKHPGELRVEAQPFHYKLE